MKNKHIHTDTSSHRHTHSSFDKPPSFNKAFALAVGLNLAFTLIEAVYAIYANSTSLLADAGHNLGDVLGLLLAWGANWLMTKPASTRYSYGFKRTTILAAIINALLLVAASAAIAIEASEKFFNPQPIQEMTVIVVASIGILINGSTALLFMQGRKQDLNIQGAFLHLAADALVSVGVVIGAILILLFGWLVLDPIIGLLIVITILLGTWGLLKDSINLILDSVPRQIDYQAVSEFFKGLPHVKAIHDLHIWGLSTKEVALTVHLVMPEGQLNDASLLEINQKLKQQFNIDHATIQIERGTVEHPCYLEGVC